MADYGVKETGGNDRGMECPICYEIYRDPKFLNCGHTLCSGCVSGLPSREIKCPICQCVAKVPPNGLPTAYAMRDMIEKWKEDNAQKFSCAECAEKRSSLDDFWTCHVCQIEFVCSKCVVKNQHSENHHMQPMADVLKGRQNQLSELRGNVEASIAQIGDQLNTAQNTINDHCKKLQACLQNEIRPYYDDALRQISMGCDGILARTTDVRTHQLLSPYRMQELLLTEVPARTESLKALYGNLKEMAGRMEDSWKQTNEIVEKILMEIGNRGVGTVRFELNSPICCNPYECSSSPECIIRGLPWMITVEPNYTNTHLGFYLRCRGLSYGWVEYEDWQLWTCRADMTFRIVSQKEGIPNRERQITSLFSRNGAQAGFADFIELNELMDESKGYIKNNTIILEVLVMAEKPEMK